jgi:hypothetical protein
MPTVKEYIQHQINNYNYYINYMKKELTGDTLSDRERDVFIILILQYEKSARELLNEINKL